MSEQGEKEPGNKAELLDLMRTGYTAFEALLAPLSAEQLCAPGVNGEWTIKDILVHLTVWQTRVSLRMEAAACHEEAQLAPIETEEQMNIFNDATFADNRARTLAEVQAEFRAAVQRLDANVAAADESDLFEAGRFPWLPGGKLWESIAGNSFGHYEEHVPMITGWLASQQA
ncbi:MAG TPA: ClbS/DfsB family four-helix bundle protein [Ktedonobacteraceae bacterium]